MTWLFLALALLVLAGGIAARRRIRSTRDREGKRITDEMVRRIEEEGSLRYEAPESLDLDEIRAEEDAFWAQTWDEPEEL